MSGVNAAPAVVVNEARAVEPNGGQDVQPKKEFIFKFCTSLIPFTTDWTIKDIDKVFRTDLEHSFMPYPRSRYFSPPNFPQLHFRLEMRPWGCDANHGDFVSMFLYLIAPSGQDVLFDLSLLNEKGETKYTRRFMKRLYGVSGEGVCNYIRRAELLDKDSELLGKDGSIRVRFEGKLVVGGPATDRDARLKKLLAKEISEGQTMRPLYESLEFTDVTLKVGASPDSEKEFKAHRGVLGCRSQVFAALFNCMEEDKESVTNINDITPDIFSEMLKYMYTGELPKLDSIAMELFEAADRYQLFNLKEICEEALCLQMEDNTQTIEALLKFNQMAKRHSSKKMEEKSLVMLQKQARDEFEKTFVASIITAPDLEAHISKTINIYALTIAPPSTNPEANASRQPTVANRNNSKRASQS